MGRPAPLSDTGQAETISVVLLLGMTIAGSITILALGTAGFESHQEAAEIQSTDHALTELDARAAMVALGDSGSQEVSIGRTPAGRYVVREDTGWVAVHHVNQSQTQPPDVEEVYNESLGAVVYEHAGTEIAYQGGGVWKKSGNGSTMVSPPEFHFQAATLTFPVIRVYGNTSRTGRVTAQITDHAQTRRLYPNSSDSYDQSGANYTNPITEGNVTVIVHSEYYRAWQTFFEDRTEGVVKVFHENNTVEVTLLASGFVGEFDMPSDGNSISISGLGGNGHSITNFTITIVPDDEDAANFADLQWSLYDDQGNQQFELHLRDGGKNDNTSTPCTERDVSATVYYSDNNGDPYHGWQNDTAFRTECFDRDGDGNNDETRLVADLNGDANMTMQDLSSSDLQHFNPSGDTRNSSAVFDEHSGNVDWEAKTFEDSGDDTTTIGNLSRHYLALMGPDVQLTVDDRSGGSVNEDGSSGTLNYDSSGSFLTFLHVTENKIKVTLE